MKIISNLSLQKAVIIFYNNSFNTIEFTFIYK